MTEDIDVIGSIEDPAFKDPLSEVTRRERKALLASCVVGLAISAGGLVPERIETFGISVNPQQEESLLYIFSGIIFYFASAFFIYSWADLKHREALASKRNAPTAQALLELQETARKLKDESTLGAGFLDPRLLTVARLSDQLRLVQQVQRVGSFRVVLDCYFPLVLGVTTITVLWSSTDGFPGWKTVGWSAVVGALLVAGIYTTLKRRQIYRWWLKKRSDRRSKKQKELLKKIKSLEPEDPEREELGRAAEDLLMRNIKDFERGIY